MRLGIVGQTAIAPIDSYVKFFFADYLSNGKTAF